MYYNIAPTYLCELISMRESSVNTRLGADHQLIMPPISKDCSNTFVTGSSIVIVYVLSKTRTLFSLTRKAVKGTTIDLLITSDF